MAEDIVIIKKYANRRLYNTQTSTYITLDDLYQMVKEGQEFDVVDAKTGNDLTHATLIQIIFEGEMARSSLMPVGFLRQLIRFYDDSLHNVLPHYLESSMEAFTQNQEKFRSQTEVMMDNWQQLKRMTGMDELENVQRQQMEIMRQTFQTFNPFFSAFPTTQPSASQSEIDELKAEVKNLKAENASLKKKL